MKRKAIAFKHLNGALKNIPGVTNKQDLCPQLIQEVEMTSAGLPRPVFRWNKDFIAKVILFDEETDARLTDTEKKYSESVQDALRVRRAEQATLAIEANNAIREAIRSFEVRGGIQVVDWDLEIDMDSPEARGSTFNQLSEIALSDFADRGIQVPDHLKKQLTTGAAAEPSGIVIKQSLPKKNPLREE